MAWATGAGLAGWVLGNAFAGRLTNAVDLDTVRDDLTSVVHTVLEPAYVWVWTSRD